MVRRWFERAIAGTLASSWRPYAHYIARWRRFLLQNRRADRLLFAHALDRPRRRRCAGARICHLRHEFVLPSTALVHQCDRRLLLVVATLECASDCHPYDQRL